MCWSSGKDSAYAVHVLRSRAEYQLAGLLTTVTKDFDRVSMHGVRRELLERQAKALELPLVVVEIPSPCSNEVYEAEMAKAIDSALDAGVSAMAFGDLFLEDVRAYRERMLARVKLKPVFPLGPKRDFEHGEHGRDREADMRQRRRHQRRSFRTLARHVVFDDDLHAERGVITHGDDKQDQQNTRHRSLHPCRHGRVVEAGQREQCIGKPQP
jgi:hypothetical protein